MYPPAVRDAVSVKLVVALAAVTVITPPAAAALTTEFSGRPVTGSAVSVALTRAAMAAAMVAGVSPGAAW